MSAPSNPQKEESALSAAARAMSEVQLEQIRTDHRLRMRREDLVEEQAHFERELAEAQLKIERPDVWHEMIDARREREEQRRKENAEMWEMIRRALAVMGVLGGIVAFTHR